MGSLNTENPPKQELDDSGYVQEEAAVKEVPPDPTCPNLLDLSDDVLLCILQYCPPMDLKALGYTCTRLGTLVLDRTLWQTVDARSTPTSKRRMHWLLAHALSAHTTALRLSGYASEHPSSRIPAHTNCPYHAYPLTCGCVPQGKYEQSDKAIRDTKVTISYAALFRLTQLCPSLTELTLEEVIIDSRVTRISLFPRMLRKLSLRGSKCVFPEEHFLDKIYDYLIYLEELDVSHCNWIEPSCMLPLSKVPRLSRLVMRHCPKLAEFTAYASLAARYGFKQLKVLDLCGSPVGDSEVSAFGWVPTLEELYLSPAENEKFDEDLPMLAEILPWEEEEPEYYASKYSTEQWIIEEASPAPLASRQLRKCTSGACVIYQQSEGVPCVYHPMPQPHLERLCPFLPNMRNNLTGENHGHRPGCSRITEDTLNQGDSQNGESSTRNGTGSLQNEVNGSQNVQSETKVVDERIDGNKRKYEESNNSEIKEDELCENDKGVAAKRQKVEENVSTCNESEYRCYMNQARFPQNRGRCSQHQGDYFRNQASCSQNRASRSSFKEVDSTNEGPRSTIRVSCNNGAPTIIEVDLFKNRINTTQNANNNNNIVSIEVDLSRNKPPTSGTTVNIEPISADAGVGCSKVEAGCSKGEAGCSKGEASCSKVEASCSKVEASCSKVEASCSKGEASCSKVEASCSKVEASCSKVEASCSKVEASCSKVEASCSKVEASCSKVEASCSKVEASCSKVEASCSKVEASCSKVEASCSKVEASCSKVETDLETEVTSSEAQAQSDPEFEISNDDINEAVSYKKEDSTKNSTPKTTNKSDNSQVNIFKESISEFKRRLLSAKNKNGGEPNCPDESNSKNDDSNNDTNNTEAVNDDDSPQAKKPKLDTKLNDTKRKLDYRDPKSNDICSDTSSNCDDDDDDQDDNDDGQPARTAGIRLPKILQVKSSNWVRNPKTPKEIMSKEARKNMTCQMIDNIRRRYEMLRHNHSNLQRDGNQIDFDANQASTSREYNQGPSNQPTNNNPQQPANNPQQPADNPQQPADNPQQPVDNPQQPAYDPQQPANNPQQPAYNPQQPANNPQQPTYNLQQPAYNPQQPDNNPRQPAFNVQLPNNPQQPPRFMRFRHNPPAVVIECFRQVGVADDNRNDEQQPDDHIVDEGEIRQPAIILPAQEVQNAEPQNRVLYVTVGRRRHALYRAAEAYRADVGANYPVSNIYPPTRVSFNHLISDSAIRRFGRADGENINYVQIGPRGIVPAPDVGSRPYRSNLRVLSVTGFPNITDSSLDHLMTAAPHLRLVDFSGTSVTEQGAMQFRCARPGCEVRCESLFD